MAARAVLATCAGWFAALCMHDIGYRLHEALVDFGLVDEETTDERRFQSFDRAAAEASRRGESKSAREESGQGFGHRDGDETRFDNPRAQAYAILGVRMGASRDEIERAYRSRMKTAHPDHGGSVERAATLNQARDLLLPRA
ncbi:DnaJ domain-containing protein [Methylocystis heyeri]|uniref:DnaJ domain-containing protein n=2 Tax=Methylocystis heyeri TaxID=391905 RepID=A0A6B8KHU4_9HYPH|nr:DnaJ domain-containing protein [Methylocystis heyeri]